MTWVKLERYVEIAGDSVDAVQARRKAGKWLNGRECKVVDGRVWINLRAVEQWIEKWE
ncbi:excisionase [Pseudoduganella sp. FT26W]|uniref:Excisionase n=2 Tax=Duganella aquatilis TaxID=2666082 RepID=A0A844D9E4_9BURK|nr:excisionase [Duganella aquatilis]